MGSKPSVLSTFTSHVGNPAPSVPFPVDPSRIRLIWSFHRTPRSILGGMIPLSAHAARKSAMPIKNESGW